MFGCFWLFLPGVDVVSAGDAVWELIAPLLREVGRPSSDDNHPTGGWRDNHGVQESVLRSLFSSLRSLRPLYEPLHGLGFFQLGTSRRFLI